MKLAGKRALITGSNRGFGMVVAATFVFEGASVMLCGRDEARLEEAWSSLAGAAPAGSRVARLAIDIAVEADVDRLVAATLAELGGLDVLVANAGIYGPKGPIEAIDWAEWVEAIRINLLGTVYSCRAVVPAMKQAGRGKIIVLSGGGATKPMPGLSAYATSKAGVVRFAETLAGELAASGIDVNSIAPGALNTRLLAEVLNAGPDKVGRAFYEASLRQSETGGDSLAQAAALCVYLASAASDGVTGKLISAKWDPWPELAAHLADLRSSDVYTLRRIVPAERGLAWGDGP